MVARHRSRPEQVRRRVGAAGLRLLLIPLLYFACCSLSGSAQTPQVHPSGGVEAAALTQVARRMDPAMLRVAARHDGSPRPDLWGRPKGWQTYDLARGAGLDLVDLAPQDAQSINALRPALDAPMVPAKPFVGPKDPADYDHALLCLTQAVYYEAALEPLEGRRAVAQTVLNRVRHPAFPKNVCGVVYQGSWRVTGCQFSFTCDGSLARLPHPGLWAEAETVAREALGGYVAKEVGLATHYHATYVFPYWAPSLVKLGHVGAHVFYRWYGFWGDKAAYRGRYAGRELEIPGVVLTHYDPALDGLATFVAEVLGTAEPAEPMLLAEASAASAPGVQSAGPAPAPPPLGPGELKTSPPEGPINAQ